jgi:hypothetical protein
MGILDVQTASEIKGYDWETVQERLAANDTKTMDLGTAILSQFQKGQQ